MKIIKLELLEDSILAGLDAMALVEKPATEEEFFAFSAEKFAETYTDYPEAAVEAAKQGIKRNEEIGNECATQVGKVRAQQLANREPISLDTVRRMRAFLIRQKDNYELARERKDYNACGYISYLLWGGEAALSWAEKTLRQAGEEFAEVGPRGGIKASPKAPKSDTPNPTPKGEGTAKGSAATGRGAEVDAKTLESLQKKADEFNEKYKEKLGYGANVGALKSVYQRGLGAYNTSRSPAVAARGGAKQWAMARVNAFLFLIKNGRPQNRNYTQDNDLLPTKHPKRQELKQIMESIIAQKMVEQMMFAVGVPHYTADGKLYEGPTHRDASGRLMTGAVHTADSEFLYHIEELSLDVSTLPNYTNEPTGELIVVSGSAYVNELSKEIQDAILESLISVGKSEADVLAEGFVEVDKGAFIKQAFATINSSPNKPSSEDFGNYAIRYQYTGPQDSKNRDFCSTMLSKNLLFRKEDINNLSVKGLNKKEFGFYDIFRYKGSFNCRHYWQEKFYLKDTKVTEAGRSIENVIRTTQAGTINPKTRTKGREQDRAGAGEERITYNLFAALDEQQILVGPAMIPGKLIPRKDENGDMYYVYFTKDTIKNIAYKAMKDKVIDRVNIEHEPGKFVDDVYLVESWIVEDPETDKARAYGLNPIEGTWMTMYKVDNLGVWEGYVKPGLVRGFSIEGFFSEELIKS